MLRIYCCFKKIAEVNFLGKASFRRQLVVSRDTIIHNKFAERSAVDNWILVRVV